MPGNVYLMLEVQRNEADMEFCCMEFTSSIVISNILHLNNYNEV